MAIAMLSLSLAACSDAAAPNEDAVGQYSLETLNGLRTPVPLGGFYNYTLEYTSSRLSLSADKSYHDQSIITSRVDGAVVQVDTSDFFGLWQQHGSEIEFTDVAHSESFVSTYKKGTITFDRTLDDSLYHYVYRKN